MKRDVKLQLTELMEEVMACYKAMEVLGFEDAYDRFGPCPDITTAPHS